MPKVADLSLEKRVRIQILHEFRKSQVYISKFVKCSRCAVQTALKRFRETGSQISRPKTGRNRITTARQDRILIRESIKDRKKTSSELAAALSTKTGHPMSARTARRRLVEAGLKGCKAKKKPWLSKKNKQIRLEWARRHQHLTEDDWKNVVLSDESNFQIFGTPGVTFVRRRVGEEFHPDCVVPTVKYGGGSTMVWGCMAADGVGEIFVCEGHMNSEKYINVVENKLLSSLTIIFGDTNLDGVKFQQDNAPCHKSATTMSWFRDNNIDLLDWPPQSPDLNPIEHIWGILKNNVRNRNVSSKKALENVLIHEWNCISAEQCTKLVQTMPQRITAVIKAKGGPTKY
ncbi:hypothetical protein ABEB36_005603 [Hypothenemus hampei]|uniref:Transposase n=1 Tax=Hypothenemus hampei TaxID=57062 RepID=A0ABD1EYT5_HYPHA